jgi:outer membrane protein, heavy metal efflux system
MDRRRAFCLAATIFAAIAGCGGLEQRLPAGPGSVAVADQKPDSSSPPPILPVTITVASELAELPAEVAGPQPVEAFIARALAENRTVQAAYHNVRSLEHRLPQVTALDDPVASNVVFPIPSVAPQYSLMGYNPYNLTLAQQFPWFGTLKLRGAVAERDVQIALAELAAAQLDSVAAVKRAYCNLFAAIKTDEILAENRKVLEDFRAIARQRLRTGGPQQDVLRAELLLSELDRERAGNQQNVAAARATLARQMHVPSGAEIQTLSELPLPSVPKELDQLSSMALLLRPELQGRLAAIARDEKAVELARKRFYPNITLGVTYMDMEKTNAVTPKTASGMPNVGLFVGFNLPVYHKKYQAGVCEAEERAKADAKLYEAERDAAFSEVQEFLIQAKVQANVLSLLRDSIEPRTRETLELARSDYAKTNVDYATVLSALREVLQVQLQVAQVSAELGKALAGLERAVGRQLSEGQKSARAPAAPEHAPAPTLLPSPSGAVSPFRAGEFRTGPEPR